MIYVYLLYKFGLFGDMIINLYYFMMSVYGWYFWSKGNLSENIIPITKIKANDFKLLTLLFLVSFSTILILYWFKPYIHGATEDEVLELLSKRYNWVDWIDSFTTAIFFVGMWLMAKKKLENWYFWIVADLISIPVYLYKGLAISSVQFLIFTVLATKGLSSWRKLYQGKRLI